MTPCQLCCEAPGRQKGRVLRQPLTALLLVSTTFCLAAAQNAESDHKPPGPTPGVPGVVGTITAIGRQTITVKTFMNAVATIRISDHTEFRQGAQPAKQSQLTVGDCILALGDEKDGVWEAKAVRLLPDMAILRQALGKRFIAGEVKRIDETKLTILRPDGATQVIEVDENTSFRDAKRGSITLADLKVGDYVLGRGDVKKEMFVPLILNVFSRTAPGVSEVPQGSVARGGNGSEH